MRRRCTCIYGRSKKERNNDSKGKTEDDSFPIFLSEASLYTRAAQALLDETLFFPLKKILTGFILLTVEPWSKWGKNSHSNGTRNKKEAVHILCTPPGLSRVSFNAGEQKVSSESRHERVNRRDRSEANSGTPKTKWRVAFYWDSSEDEPQHSGPGQLTNTGSRLRTVEEDIGHSFAQIFKAAIISIFIRLSQYLIFTIWLSRLTEFTIMIIINDSHRKSEEKKKSSVISIFNFVYLVSFLFINDT